MNFKWDLKKLAEPQTQNRVRAILRKRSKIPLKRPKAQHNITSQR